MIHRSLRWLLLSVVVLIGNNLGDENEVRANRWLMHDVLADAPLEETLTSRLGLLNSGYRLRVMQKIPPMPAEFIDFGNSREVRDNRGETVDCPIEVRAIVRGSDDSFAVVITAKGRKVIRHGDKISTTWGYAQVISIAEHAVRLRHRGVPVNCPFSL